MRSSTFAKPMSKAKKVEIAGKQPCAASRLFKARMLMQYSYYMLTLTGTWWPTADFCAAFQKLVIQN